ncbi:MAG: hypothetical protein LW854_10615 [Rubrivivax sp.]|nr:hypothetical protein [Rubrivivax sp.]
MSPFLQLGSYCIHMLVLAILWHRLKEDVVAFVLPIGLGVSLLCVGAAQAIEEKRRRLNLRFQLKGNPLATQGTLFLCAAFLAGWFLEGRLSKESVVDLFIYSTALFFWMQAFAGFLNYFRTPA